jgi:hypothetical protein
LFLKYFGDFPITTGKYKGISEANFKYNYDFLLSSYTDDAKNNTIITNNFKPSETDNTNFGVLTSFTMDSIPTVDINSVNYYKYNLMNMQSYALTPRQRK